MTNWKPIEPNSRKNNMTNNRIQGIRCHINQLKQLASENEEAHIYSRQWISGNLK